MLDLLLIASVGFLGSFGHCLGMCSPLTVAFSLSNKNTSRLAQFRFNLLLNLGRILSYALVGAAIGSIGSVLIAGGQLAGIDSALRRGLAIVTGILLIWYGLSNINPDWLPKVPILHPMQGKLHNHLSKFITERSHNPAILGMIWGLIPCGFLYTAQIKAAETGNLVQGAMTMLAFGAGTAPMMISTGLFAGVLSRDRRSQLFKLAGWVTLTIGLLTLFRSSDMVDYTGHAALICLMMALIARPISRIWAAPLRYRRALGVGAFVLSCAHMGHFLDHTFNWNLSAIVFLLPTQQIGIWSGISALGLMLPAAFTSFDKAVSKLGFIWRKIHLFSIPALILAGVHTVMSGSNYLGEITIDFNNRLRVGILIFLVISVLLIRSRFFWSLLSLESLYVSAKK
ncbi:MAG: sulfite exporter TauE/SafE family protein [Leptolyngbya sp. Prado105]|jgi:hypothetical protein|nr:sulfite exporter TauE/SafE family protein [Leptolyngbya sp. Prado105]